jgi:hypothetical protein
VNFGRRFWIWVAVIAAPVALVAAYQATGPSPDAADAPHGAFLNKPQVADVKNVTIDGTKVTFETSNGTMTTYAPDAPGDQDR